MSYEKVVIIDFGSRYTKLIANKINEQGVYYEIKPCESIISGKDLNSIFDPSPSAIILSGRPSSIYDPSAPILNRDILDSGIPILGICYGLHTMIHSLGGKIEQSHNRDQRISTVNVINPSGIFNRFSNGDKIKVWKSHVDKIASLPHGFEILGISNTTPYEAVANINKSLYGVQFHPELIRTIDEIDIISTFLFDIAKIEPITQTLNKQTINELKVFLNG